MKKLVYIVLLISVTVFGQDIKVDKAQARVSFNFVDDDVGGYIEGFNFSGNYNPSNSEEAVISGSVATETINTNNWLRNRHLRRKYFKAKEYPKLSFNGKIVEKNDAGFTVVGTLTIKGITKTVTWSFTDDKQTLMGTLKLNTQDFDISIHKEREKNDVVISILMPYSMK